MFNIARLFSYTRRLEDELRAARVSISEERRFESGRNTLEIERLRDRYADEIHFLREELKASRAERQFLQDRLLQRGGMNPIYEASPGEIARTATSSTKKEVLSPRQQVQRLGEQSHAGMRAEIDRERDAFLEEQKAKGSAAAQTTS